MSEINLKTAQEFMKQGRNNANQERKNQSMNHLNAERRVGISTRSITGDWTHG